MTRKVIRKRIRYDKDGVQVAADVNAVIASNVRRREATTTARKRRIQITTRRLARTWVRAGAVHDPPAQRCHESRSPAPMSMGSTQAP